VPDAAVGAVDLDDEVPAPAQERDQPGAVGSAALDAEVELLAELTRLALQPRVTGPVHRDRVLTDHGSDLVQCHRDVEVLVGVVPDDDASTKWVGDARHWLRVLPGLRGHGAAGRADRTVMGASHTGS